jgi:hypothetical protein
MKRIVLTTLIVSVTLLIFFSLKYAVKNNCPICAQFYLYRHSFTLVWGGFCTSSIYFALTKLIKLKRLWLKMIMHIVTLGLTTQAIIWAWAAAEVVIYYGGFSNLSIETVQKDIEQQLGGLTFWALILSICIPFTYEFLERRGIKPATNKN